MVGRLPTAIEEVVTVELPDSTLDRASPAREFPVEEDRVLQQGDSVAFAGLLGTLMFAVLAFGSTEPWSQFILTTLSSCLLTLWCVLSYREGEIKSVSVFRWSLALAFVAAVLVRLFQPDVYRHAALIHLRNIFVYIALTTVALRVFRTQNAHRRFAMTLGVFGYLVAMEAMFQGFTDSSRKIYWFRSMSQVSAAPYGPYVNHSHYAGLMELLVPLCIGAACVCSRPKRPIFVFASLVMMTSSLLSRSRGGAIALLGEALFATVVLLIYRRGSRSVAYPAVIFLLTISAVAYLDAGSLRHRFLDLHDAHRVDIYRVTCKMILKHPIAGFGLGSFQDNFAAYQTFPDELTVNSAHNDFLELLVETGVVGLGIFALFVIQVFQAGIKALSVIRDGAMWLLALAYLTGIVGLLIHGLLDFNLHVPANAALFFTICAGVLTFNTQQNVSVGQRRS